MATIRQYAAWAEQKIARLVVQEGLSAGLLGVTQGPMVLSYKVRLLKPSPSALRKLLSLGPALAQALHVPQVRISEQPGFVAIEIPSPVKRTPRAIELARASRGLMVAVGLDAHRRPVRVNLEEHGAVFWIGPSRRGKTQSMKSTLYALATRNRPHLHYVILSQKHRDWQSFEHAAGCLGIVHTPEEAHQALSWAAVVQAKRAVSGRRTGALVVVCDDLLNLLSSVPELATPLSEISSQGAGLGVHLLAGTQEAGSKRGTGGAGVENNATARILYRSSSATAAARATGQGAAGLQMLSGAKGDALLLLDGEPIRIATGLSDDRAILQLPHGTGQKRVWVRPTTTPQPGTTTGNRQQPAQPPVAPPPGSDAIHATVGEYPQPVGSVAAVVDIRFPIEKRAPTPEEAAVIAKRHRAGDSLNALCRLVYGHKDGKAYQWVKQAVTAAEDPTEGRRAAAAQNDTRDLTSIDMNTAEGVKAVEELQNAGLLPPDTITQLVLPQEG